MSNPARLHRRLVGPLTMVIMGLAIPSAHSQCRPPLGVFNVLTHLNSPVPPDGSLLVSLGHQRIEGGLQLIDTDGTPTLPPLALVQGNVTIALRPTDVAPGLVRLDFERPPPAGVYTVHGLTTAGTPRTTITIGGTLPPPPSPPSVTHVTYGELDESHNSMSGRFSILRRVTRVRLSQPLPSGTQRLLLRPVGEGPVAYLGASSSTTLEDEDMEDQRCPPVPWEGTGHVSVGSRVVALAVDHFGRMSEPTPPVRVMRGRTYN